jgi:hypothetical protein
MIGSVHNIVLSMLNASKAFPEMGSFVYSASFLVALFSGSQILAKSLMCVQKKLHSPTKDLISSFV